VGEVNVTSNGGRKVAIYARVSTGKQDQSLEEQTRLIKEWCTRQNYEIIDVYSETGSGAKEDRKEYNNLMHEVEMYRNKFDTIVVWKLDRFSRSLQSLVNSIDFLKKREVDFVSISDNIETTTPAGKLMFHIFGALAEFERDLIHERTKIGIDRAKREGIVCNRPKKVVDIDRVITLYNSGNAQFKEIARMYGISTVTLWKRLKEGGVEKHLHKLERGEKYRYPPS
jgi:DNA invertase Pin-like site-specific DNA recombinase